MPGTELMRREGRIAKMDRYLMLPDGTVRLPYNYEDWCFWITMEVVLRLRMVAVTETAMGRVSTIFLGIDHDSGLSWGWERDEEGWPVPILPIGYRPLVFETMIFGGPRSGYQRRYRTREEALAGHRETLAMLRESPIESHPGGEEDYGD